jgi:hypothetical protein
VNSNADDDVTVGAMIAQRQAQIAAAEAALGAAAE